MSGKWDKAEIPHQGHDVSLANPIAAVHSFPCTEFTWSPSDAHQSNTGNEQNWKYWKLEMYGTYQRSSCSIVGFKPGDMYEYLSPNSSTEFGSRDFSESHCKPAMCGRHNKLIARRAANRKALFLVGLPFSKTRQNCSPQNKP